ncbi:hypothetical protein SpCBS45565_g00200 [Spizellomyces sp. 'palustris']|nr:hypothetical protein SpCBS45565_g00200 [Spizellomyces sp. 'palustris']
MNPESLRETFSTSPTFSVVMASGASWQQQSLLPPVPPGVDVSILNKMAEYVARNGQEFLEITKERQKHNPRYRFLWPEDANYPYFHWKVQQFKKPGLLSPHGATPQTPVSVPQIATGGFTGTPTDQVTPLPPTQLDPILTQQLLSALGVTPAVAPISAPILNPLQTATDKVCFARDALATSLSNKDEVIKYCGLLDALMKDCSQTNIHAGKSWIFENCTTASHVSLLAQLLEAISEVNTTFESRLHLIYLVNDVLYHGRKRHQEWIGDSFLPHLGPMLSNTYTAAIGVKKKEEKVLKVLTIWSDKRFFSQTVIDGLRSRLGKPERPPHAMAYTGNASLPAVPQDPSNLLSQEAQPGATFQGVIQIAQPIPSAPLSNFPHIASIGLNVNRDVRQEPSCTVPHSSFLPHEEPKIGNSPPASAPESHQSSRKSLTASVKMSPPTTIQAPPANAKYYELPAGLMVAAISLDRKPYQQIAVSKIRALSQRPPPIPDLLAAVDEFYSGLNIIRRKLEQERQKDGFEETPGEMAADQLNSSDTGLHFDKDGWEIGYLDDWYRKVEGARRRHEPHAERADSSLTRKRGQDNRTRSRSPSRRGRIRQESLSRAEKSRSRSHDRRRSHDMRRRASRRERSKSTSSSSSSSSSRSRSPGSTDSGSSDDRSRSRTRSGSRKPGKYTHRSQHHRGYSGSRSPRGRRSETPVRGLGKRTQDNSRRGSSGTGSRKRSESPPFSRPQASREDHMISKRNVGYKLMKKLGWSEGSGLGASAQGIAEPIRVDATGDKFVGLGAGRSGDGAEMFEQWRKARSYCYTREPPASRSEPIGCYKCGR